MATSTAQFFETSWNMEQCNICVRHFANPAKIRNLATFWPELDLGQICKNGRFSTGAEIWYSPRMFRHMYVSFSVKLLLPASWKHTDSDHATQCMPSHCKD